ncbi:MAG: aminotransferase class I/II-fold pyridoxal phosphate-dependent enzyme [Gemmatimonadetes bacterium]|nr:aminotransferase class I/II-fold pyridoxal phosphate-dependent enzyme [Gemmatimonadota bacterium]
MDRFRPFLMERWQSTWEYVVDYNLSESGVHPLTVGELLALAGADVDHLLLGYGQSNGSRELRSHIARLYRGAGENNVVVTNGSAEANFVVMWNLVEPGDAVAAIMPTYMQAPGLAHTMRAEVREIPLRLELGWQPDPDEIAARVTERTRMIVVTNPNNPTGAVLSDDARAAIVRAADRVGAWILADEVYTGAELSGASTPSFWGEYPRTVTTGSLSKAYGLPGLRIGWVVAPADKADELWARTDYTSISPGELTDRLAAMALRPDVRSRILERTRAHLLGGLAVLDEWLHDQGVFAWTPPEAGAICFARYDLPVNSSELAERLRVDRSVLVVPGDHFGMDGFIRFGFGIPEAALRVALSRVAETVAELRPARVGT